MGLKQAFEKFADEYMAIIILVCIIPTLCYLAITNNNPDNIYALVGIVTGYYFSKKV